MFDSLTIHGGAGSVLWGDYRVAVEVKTWRIVRTKAEGGQWILNATIARINKYQARQTPLSFSAPRPGGFWLWPIQTIAIGETNLQAQLGPPVR